MAFTPQSDVYLLNVPLKNDGSSTFTFASKGNQTSYFQSKLVSQPLQYHDFTYQRKDGALRVPVNFEDLWDVNYVMYRNDNFGDRWVYAFARPEYVNPGVSKIYLTTDYWQTFLFDFTLGQCRISREIIKKSKDKLFSNTLPEDVNANEYYYESLNLTGQSNYSEADFAVGGYILASQFDITQSPARRGVGQRANGVSYPISIYGTRTQSEMDSIIRAINSATDGAITYCTTVPKFVYDHLTIGSGTGGYNKVINPDYETYMNCSLDLSEWFQSGRISSHLVKNNKCFNYTSMYATNNGGNSMEYNFALFTHSGSDFDPTFNFTAYGNIDESNCVAFVPTNYATGYGLPAFDFGLKSQTYPTKPYTIEQNNYFKQQQLMARDRIDAQATNLVMTTAESAAKAAATYGTGMALGEMYGSSAYTTHTKSQSLDTGIGTVGGIAQGLNSLDLAEKEFSNMQKEQSLVNYTYGGLSGCADVMACAGLLAPKFYWKVPRQDEIEMIDSYFDMFGYNVSRTGVPNFKKRTKWDYLKCTTVNFASQHMPQEASDFIEKTLLSGMTFWHNPGSNTPYDYSQNNTDAS